MTFEIFDDLRLWADTLQEYLNCVRYFASVCSAPKSSRLHAYLPSPRVSNSTMDTSTSDALDATDFAQPLSVHSASTYSSTSTYYTYFSNFLSRVIHPYQRRHEESKSDGFLHVTVDRLLFVAFSGHKPVLVSSWNFINGDISVYGTGRISASASGERDSKIFYLVEPAGRCVFACEKAAELSTWIQRVTRPASFLYERRWLSSVSAQLGKDQAIVLLPFNGAGKQFQASLGDISENQASMASQRPPNSARCVCKDSSPTASICLPHFRGSATCSYRPANGHRIRFLSHPNDKSVLSSCIGHIQTGRQHDGCVLRHSFCNVSCAHNLHPPLQHPIQSTGNGPCNTSLTSTMTGSTADLSDDESPAMVELSPLPLDYLPGFNTSNATITKDKDRNGRSSHEDAAVLEVNVEVHNPASNNAASSSKISSTSPKSTFYSPSLSPTLPTRSESPTQRTSRSRLTNSWSTSITNFSPFVPSSVLPSSSQSNQMYQNLGDEEYPNKSIEKVVTEAVFRGAKNSISVLRAVSECRDFTPTNSVGCTYMHQWSRTHQHTSSSGGVVGVACSVPWDAAPTAQKPRTGQLYSTREKIREAALKVAAAAVSPLSSLPSGKPSPPPSASSDDEANNETETAGKLRIISFVCLHSQTVTNVPPLNSAVSEPSRQTSVLSSNLPRYVNLSPLSPPSVTASSPPMAIMSASTSQSARNYLSYSPYVPLSRQRSSISGHWQNQVQSGGRMRTLSSE
ncbi:unnamed protein product [Rodentolepis nana]|uniref:IRS-type PTB domain-containing protein n=1 Tax=Rodentolepis nana TaxID=102285 RepID=A0A158QGF5_RODNA|nr:unnamed protein product [Rodentolepis nana]